MPALAFVELERVDDAVDDALGDAGGVASLASDVVLAGDSGEQRNLLAAQTGDSAAAGAVDGQLGLLGADAGSSGGQKIPELAADVAPDLAPDLVPTGGSGVSWPAMSASLRAIPAGWGFL